MKGAKKKYGPRGFIPPDRNQRLAAVALPRLAAAKVVHMLVGAFPHLLLTTTGLPFLHTALALRAALRVLQDERSRRLHAYLEEAVQDETAFRPITIPQRTRRTAACAVCCVCRVCGFLC
jgi:hypothetical protein